MTIRYLIYFLLSLLVPSALHAEVVFPDRGTSAVVDTINVFTPQQKAELNKTLVQWQQRTQHQFVVATVPSLQGYSISEYGYQLGRHWKLGRTDIDDAAILLWSAKERTARLEVGRGLEGVLTDAKSKDIIRGVFIPRASKNDVAGALIAGSDAALKILDGDKDGIKKAPSNLKPSNGIHLFLWGILGLIAVMVIWSLFRSKPKSITKPKSKPLGTAPSSSSPVYKAKRDYVSGGPNQTSSSYKWNEPSSPTRYDEPVSSADPLLTALIVSELDEEPQKRYAPDSSPAPTESYGFTSDNDSDRGFAGGGANESCQSDSSDSDSGDGGDD